MLGSPGDWLGNMQSMQKEMVRLLNYLGSSKPPAGHFAPIWEPAVDVYETAADVVVVVELPGVKQDDIEIVVDNNYLVVRGQRRETALLEKRNYYQMEIHRGPFERRILLPARINPDKTRASHEDGILEIVLLKTRQDTTLRVNIKISSQC